MWCIKEFGRKLGIMAGGGRKADANILSKILMAFISIVVLIVAFVLDVFFVFFSFGALHIYRHSFLIPQTLMVYDRASAGTVIIRRDIDEALRCDFGIRAYVSYKDEYTMKIHFLRKSDALLFKMKYLGD